MLLQIPGNDFTLTYAPETCNTQYGLPVGSYNQTNFGVSTKDNCENVPESLRPACRWRFDWLNNNDFNKYGTQISVYSDKSDNILQCNFQACYLSHGTYKYIYLYP